MVSKQRLFLIFCVIVGTAFCKVDFLYGVPRDRNAFDTILRLNGGSLPKGAQDLMAVANINELIDQAEKELRDMEALGANNDGIRHQERMIEALKNNRDRQLVGDQLAIQDIRALNDEIKASEAELRSMLTRAGPDRVQAHTQMIQALKTQRNKLLGVQSSSAKIGTLIARGLGGKTWDSFGFQQDAEDFSDGVKKGLMIRISEAFGNALSSKVQATIDLILGGTWDFVLLSTLDMWEDVCKIMFHNSCDPFKPTEVEGWQKLIIESMKQVERNVKEGPKDNFRGHDMTRRSFGEEEKQTDFDESSISLSAWRMYVLGCVEQFEYFIQLIEKRKKYYKEDKLIVFYAEQIQSRLSDYKELMLKANSVKDFDDYIESNKSLLPAMRENVEQLFKRLAEESKPRTVFSGNSGSIRPAEVSRQRQNNDDDMPNRFGNGWGG